MPRRTRALGLLVLLLLVCACAFAQAQQPATIPALDSPVVDTTGTLDAVQKQALEQQALALQQRKGSQLQVLVVPSTQPETIEQYAVRAFEQWKLGRAKVDDGVLLVVAKDDRKVRIEVGYGLEGAIPDIAAGRIIQEYLVPKFRAGDYGGGITDATAALVKLIDGEPLPEPMADAYPRGSGAQDSSGGNWFFALMAAFVVASIARGILGGTPVGVRGLLGGAAGGGVAWLLSSLLLVGGVGALIGLWIGLSSAPKGRYARDRGWGSYGGGGWGGGGFGGGMGGGGMGGGWSGGGGMSGGGGASGSW